MVVVALLVLNLVPQVNALFNAVTSIAFAILTPWVICQALRFRAHNTSWRNMRMGFGGKARGVAKVLYLYGLAVPFSAGLALPWWRQRYQRYLTSHLRFGAQPFVAAPRVSDYYKAYGVLALCVLVVAGGLILSASKFLPWLVRGAFTLGARPSPILVILIVGATLLFGVVVYFFSATYLRARLGNALWNNVTVGKNAFRSTLSARQLFWLVASNTLATVVTLGFFAPFAKVRMARYRAETLSLAVSGDLEEFVREESARVQALGDETAEFFDVDLGF